MSEKHRSFRRGLLFAGAIALLCLIFLSAMTPTTSVVAQEEVGSDEYTQRLVNAGNRTIAGLLTTFRPHLPQAKRYLLTPERIYVAPVSSFNAYANYTTQEILIPFQVVLEAHLQAQAYVYVQNAPSAGRHYNPYLQYLAERSRAAFDRFIRRETDTDDLPIMAFWTYAQLPKPRFSDDDGTIVAKLMISSLATIVGHELGHLVLGHKPYTKITPEQSRQQEFDADRFAVKLIRDAGGSVIPGLLTIYLRFVISEALFKGVEGTHPRGSCRLYRMFKWEFDQIRGSPAGMRQLESSGMNLAEIDSLMEETRRSCNL